MRGSSRRHPRRARAWLGLGLGLGLGSGLGLWLWLGVGLGLGSGLGSGLDGVHVTRGEEVAALERAERGRLEEAVVSSEQ